MTAPAAPAALAALLVGAPLVTALLAAASLPARAQIPPDEVAPSPPPPSVAGPGLPAGDIWPDAAMSDEEAAAAARRAMPFTQDQIIMLGRLLQQTRAAAALGDVPPPAGRVRQARIDPAGTSTPPTILLRHGYTTALSVTDVTGAPWPIDEVVVDSGFLPGGSEGERAAEVAHLLYFVASRQYAHGNAAVKLQDLAEPVVLALREGGPEVDFRVDLRVPLPGPQADLEALTRPGILSAGDDVLVDLLHGITPAGAEALDVEGGLGRERAWRLGDAVLVATRAEILSPAPLAAERGAGRVWAYRLPLTPYALLATDGREMRVAFRTRARDPELDALAAGALALPTPAPETAP